MSKNNPNKAVDNSQKELAKREEFQPTPAMIVWVDAAVKLGTDNKSEIERECNVSRNNWYEWIKQDGFEDWFFTEYKRKRRRWLPKLDEIGMKYAKRGDHNFWKDMNKKAGEDLDAKKAPQVAVQVNNITSKKSDEYGI